MTALIANPQASLLPTPQEWSQMMQMGQALLRSGLLPTTIKAPETAVAIMLKGRELHIPPMQAFAQISIINGKPSMNAELQLALIYRGCPSAEIQISENTAKSATVKARRGKAEVFSTFSFFEEDAKRADLLSKGPWKQYPKSMYLWRAISMMARAMFPDCLMGVSHTPEELGADVDGEGNVIDIHAEEHKQLEETPKPEPRRTASIYDHSDHHMQKTLASILEAQKVDELFWERIGLAMNGRPSTDMKTVIAEVLANGA